MAPLIPTDTQELYDMDMSAVRAFWLGAKTADRHERARLAALLAVEYAPVDLDESLPSFIQAIDACRQQRRAPSGDALVAALRHIYHWTVWRDAVAGCERRLRAALADRANAPYREPLARALHIVVTYIPVLATHFSLRDALAVMVATDKALDEARALRWQAADAAICVYDDPVERDAARPSIYDTPANEWDTRSRTQQMLDFLQE